MFCVCTFSTSIRIISLSLIDKFGLAKFTFFPFPFSKGDQKSGGRVPISSKLVADLMKRAGASCVMMLDPHSPQLEGFFDTPVDALRVREDLTIIVTRVP